MKLNKDNLIGVIIGFIVLVIFAICLSSGCAKRITPVPEIRYVPVTDSTAVNELVLTKELLRTLICLLLLLRKISRFSFLSSFFIYRNCCIIRSCRKLGSRIPERWNPTHCKCNYR